jgi:hypothetical protein
MGQLVSLESAPSFRLHPTRPAEPRLTGAELCAVLRVSPSTLKRWRGKGLPFEPWSPRLYRYVLSEVLAWRTAQGV